MLTEILDHTRPTPREALGHERNPLFFEPGIDLEKDFFDAHERGEEPKRPTTHDGEDVSDEIVNPFTVDSALDIADIRWYEEESLVRIIEIRGEHMLGEALHRERLFDIGKIPMDRKGGTRSDTGIEGVIELVIEYFSDMQRSDGGRYLTVLHRDDLDRILFLFTAYRLEHFQASFK